MAKTIITLGREYCTGGRYIAEDVANALGIKLYDKELITMAANTAASIIPITVNTITGSISVNPSVDDLAEFWAAVEPEPKINDRISPTSTAFQ